MHNRSITLLVFCLISSFLFPQGGKARVIEELLFAARGAKVLKAAKKAGMLWTALETNKVWSGAFKSDAVFVCFEEENIVSHARYMSDGQMVERQVNYEKLLSLPAEDLNSMEIFVEPEVYASDKFAKIKYKPNVVNIVTQTHDIMKVYPQQQLIEWTPSLKCKYVSESQVIDFHAISTWYAYPEDITVASILDPVTDFSTAEALRSIAKKNSKPFHILDTKNIESVFADCKEKFLILTGHFDGKKFFARDALYREIPGSSFSLEEIERLEKKYDIYVMKIGCQTQRKAGTGLLNDIYDQEVIERVDLALQQVLFLDMLAQLGSKTNPLYVSPVVFGKYRMLLKAHTQELENGLKNTVITITSSSIPIYNSRGVSKVIENVHSIFKPLLILAIIALLLTRHPVAIGFTVIVVILYAGIYSVCKLIQILL